MKFDPVSYAMGTQAAGSGSDLSDATATRADILYPKTAYLANGRKNVGTIQSIEATTYTPSIINQTITAGKYLAGDQTILGDSNLTAENIKNNISIFGITGNYTGTFDENKTVHFVDYDGSVLYAYTPQDFISLAQFPANPSHEGLIAQGWNWDIIEAQEYVAEYGGLDIGQMYVTASGKTEIDIELKAPYLTPYLGLWCQGTTIVDWGDGNTTTITGSGQRYKSHTYATSGKYTISIEVRSSYDEIRNGLLFIRENTSDNSFLYKMAIKAVRLGNNIQLGTSSFANCKNLEYITLPNTITSLGTFSQCESLKYIVIPSSATTAANGLFSYCINLQGISLPNNNLLANYTSVFSYCYKLSKIYLPNVLTTIPSYTFYQCYGLQQIDPPSSINTIGSFAFASCRNLKTIVFPNSVTILSGQVLRNDSIQSVTLPENLTTIQAEALYECSSLTKLTIPATVTSIKSQALYSCYSLTEIHFLGSTPPVLDSSSTIYFLPANCIIYVPTGSLEAYTTATNYPSSSTYTYMEE